MEHVCGSKLSSAKADIPPVEIWSESMSVEMDLDLVEKVIHQLVKDWSSERDRDVAVWLIGKLSYDDIEEYFRDLK